MRVVVEVYGTLQRFLRGGQRRVELEVEENTTVRDLLLKLGIDMNEPWNASLNGTLANPSGKVSKGSFVLVFRLSPGDDWRLYHRPKEEMPWCRDSRARSLGST